MKGSCSTSVHPQVHMTAWEFGWYLSQTAGCLLWGCLSTPAPRGASIHFTLRQVLALAWQSCMTSHINRPSRSWIQEQTNAGWEISELLSSKVTRSARKKKNKIKKARKKLEPTPITFPLLLYAIGNKFLQTIAPCKPENNVMDRVMEGSQSSKTSNQDPEVVPFTIDMSRGPTTICHRLSDLPDSAAT